MTDKNNQTTCKMPGNICFNGTFYPSDVWLETQLGAVRAPNASTRHIDLSRGIWQGLVIGIGSPIFIRPFEKAQIIITSSSEKFSWSATFSTLTREPYKGLPFHMLFNAVRRSIVFGTIPVAQNYLLDAGWSASGAKNIAPAFAGAAEGLLIAPYVVIDQYLQSSKARNFFEARRALPQHDFNRVLPIAARMGALCGGTFWPIYSYILNQLEQKIKIHKDSYLLKISEEIIIGAGAGALTSVFTFPIYSAMLRQIANPQLSLSQDYYQAKTQYGFGKKLLTQHYYKGFYTGLARIVIGMGAVNSFKYVADVSYDTAKKLKNTMMNVYGSANQQTFFHPAAAVLDAKPRNETNEFIFKSISC